MAAKHPSRKTCQRFNVPDHAHFVTFSCFQRREFLVRDRTRGWLADSIVRANNLHRFHLWAYVFMPEHVHLLIRPTEAEYSISRWLKSVKLPVAIRAIRYVTKQLPEYLPQFLDEQPDGERHYRFWQRGGGHDVNLWSVDNIWAKIDYTHNNPVTRGLCSRSDEWQYSSAADFLGLRKGPIPLDLSLLPRQ